MPGASPDRRNTVSHRWLRHPVNEVHAGQRREHLAVLQACSIAARPVAADPIMLVCHDTFNRALLGQIDPSLSHVRQRTACCRKLRHVNGDLAGRPLRHQIRVARRSRPATGWSLPLHLIRR